MIPYLLAVLGGYLIGDSIGEDIDKKIPEFAEGGLSDQLEKIRGQRDSSVINPDELYRKLGEAERNWQKDGGEEYARVQRQIQENRKLYFKKLSEAERNWNSDNGAEYTRLIDMRDKFEEGGMMAKGGRIDRMVKDWKVWGYAMSHINNDDSEFFEKIGRTYMNTPNTSFTGNDIAYYDDERVETTTGGFKKKMTQEIIEYLENKGIYVEKVYRNKYNLLAPDTEQFNISAEDLEKFAINQGMKK